MRSSESLAAGSVPPLRKSTADVLSDIGWLQGTFHVPLHQSLVDFLAPGVQIIKCTRVRVPQESDLIPFVALRRESVHLVEPTQPDEIVETPGSIGRTTPRTVGCLLAGGVLRGTLDVLINVRVSDFLRQQPGLLVLRRCVLTRYGEPPDSPQARKLATVIVNLARVLGVSEWDSPRS